ncbi:uricase [Arthrobacter sp. Hiyo4]|nr:uricase [Arthrobacter sp. Hiyo4]
MSNKIVLGDNQYGKAEVRVVKVTRDTDRHQIEDLNVTSQLRGDFEAAHLQGDNAHVVATDTQKNTIYAFARAGVGSPKPSFFASASTSRQASTGLRAAAGKPSPTPGTASSRTAPNTTTALSGTGRKSVPPSWSGTATPRT